MVFCNRAPSRVIARRPKKSSFVAWPGAPGVEGAPFMRAGAPCIAGPLRVQGCHEPNLAAENFRGSIFEGRFLECRFSRDDFSRVDFSSVDRDKGPLSKGRLRSKGPLSKVHMRPVVLCSTPGGSNECRSCQPDRRPPLRACGAQCAPRDEEALKRKAETRRDAAKNLDDAHKPRTANHREGPPCHEGGGGGRHGGRLPAIYCDNQQALQ